MNLNEFSIIIHIDGKIEAVKFHDTFSRGEEDYDKIKKERCTELMQY